jgi:hypothetical protein
MEEDITTLEVGISDYSNPLIDDDNDDDLRMNMDY